MSLTSGYLDGRKDLQDYADWIYAETNDWRNVNASEFNEDLSDEEIDEALDEARELMKELFDEFENQGSPEDVHSVLSPSAVAEPFNRFINCLREDRISQYTWQMWTDRDKDLTILESEAQILGLPTESIGKPIGYSDKLLRSRLLKNTALIQHTYESPPESIIWNLTPVNQGSQTVYMGAEAIAEIDAVTKVPWIPPTLQSNQFAGKALSGGMREDDEWQRLVSKARLEQIRNFARGNSNFMFNPVLMYVNKNHESISFEEHEGKASVSIDFSFLRHKNGLYYDYLSWPKEVDQRPIWIVDGQHRVRGFGGSARGSMLRLPFVIMVGDGSEEDRELVARIFTEINTNAKQLDKMHQLYLRWEFRIPSESAISDFEANESGEPTNRSRSNRKAYDLALELAGNSESPLYDSIQFQEPDKSSAPRARMKRHLIVKSTNWMQIARKWFSSNGIYPDSDSDEYSTTEILNFFLAFEQNCNHEEWEDGKNRWRNERERKSKRSIIQQQGPFRALMSLIPFSVKRLEILFGVTNRPFTIEQFKSVLSPLRNIDWNLDTKDTQGLSVLKGRGNLNVPHLRDWMETAIEHGQIYSWQEVHNPELRSLPGRGLNARPSDEGLEIDVEGDSPPWPGTLPLMLTISKPIHAIRGWWEVTQTINGKQEVIDVSKGWVSSPSEDKSQLILESGAISRDAEMIRINAGWRNGIGDVLANEPYIQLAP